MTTYMIPDVPKDENPYNLKIGASVWQYKEWTIALHGGVILSYPKATPLSFCVFGLLNMGVKVGDFVLVPQDNTNSPRMRLQPSETDPLILKAEFFADELFGQIKRIDGNRIILESELRTKYGDKGWPKVHGAVAKVLGYDRDMIDEKKSKEVADAQRIWGSQWAEKLNQGAWTK